MPQNSKPKPNRLAPVELSSYHGDLPRPTSSVPTLDDLLVNAGMSPCKPSSADAYAWTREEARKKKKKNSLSRRPRDSVEMDLTVCGGVIHEALEKVPELDESVEATTASDILVSIGKQKESLLCEDSFDDRYNNDVDNFVVNYDSDVSITMPLRSTKIPGFTNLYDEEDFPTTTGTNTKVDTSNNSELDMSMTRTFKFEASGNADITNHFVTDMSIMNFTKPNLSMDDSADMSMTRMDIGKLAAASKPKMSADDSVDMSVTNIRIPDPNATRHFNSDDMSLTRVGFGDDNSEGDMSMTRTGMDVSQLSDSDSKFAGYNSTVNNFVVTYDDDVSITMHLKNDKSKQIDEEASPTIPPAKYNSTVDNFVVNYDDEEEPEDFFNPSAQLNLSGDNDSMTMTRTDLGKIVDADISMTMTRTDFGKIAEANLSAREDLTDSVLGKKDGLNTSVARGKDDLNTSVVRGTTPNIFTKILTPRKTPMSAQQRTAETPTAEAGFAQSFPFFSSSVQQRDGSASGVPATPTDEKISTVEEFLNGSKRAPSVVDEDQFSFARFLQLASLRFYQEQRVSIGVMKRHEAEEPSETDILESAFITRHDFNDMQTAGEQLRALSAEKKQAAERIEKLLAASLAPPKLYSQLQSEDPAEVAQATKQANKLMAFSKVQAKVEFLERRQQPEQTSLAVKRHGLELLRQDAVRLASMVKSLKELTDELPTDIRKLEHTKRLQQNQQIQQAHTAGVLPKFFLSTSSQTKSKSSKRIRTEHTSDLERKMNEDFELLQFMQQSLHWVPRVFTETELLFHWDFYKIHISIDPSTSTVTKTSFSLINSSQRLNDFHVGVMKNAQIHPMLQSLKSTNDLPQVLQKVFHRLNRVRLVFNTVKRLSTTYHVKTDSKFIRHTPANENAGVIEIQFSDHRATTKFGVVFELTCAYPFSDLVAIPRKPLFGNVTVAGISTVLASVEPGYERMERACAALLDLAVAGKDPVVYN